MRSRPFVRLLSAGAGLWAAGWVFLTRQALGRGKHVAIDPRDPAADPDYGPAPVRAAGPEATRSRYTQWDKVDESVDESFPASDPPAT